MLSSDRERKSVPAVVSRSFKSQSVWYWSRINTTRRPARGQYLPSWRCHARDTPRACCQRRDAAHAAARTRHPATRTAGDGGLRWGQPSVSRGRKASALFGLPSRRDHGRLRATRYSDGVRLAPGARHFPWPPPVWNPGGGPFQPSISTIFRTGLLLAPSMPVSSSTCQDVHRGLVRPSLRR
jgi:hypothetical protein